MQDINKVLAEEGAAAEQNVDAPTTSATKVSRPGRQRSTVFSVRLNDEEMAALQAEAEAQRVPASTLARAMIVRQLPTTSTFTGFLDRDFGDITRSLDNMQATLRHVRQAFTQDILTPEGMTRPPASTR